MDSGTVYLFVKALHLLSLISWMAGMLYLPRLFVYHVDAEVGGVQSETFKVMERRLLKAIMTPAMLATWIFGIWLLSFGTVDMGSDIWFHIKLTLVIAMTVIHMMVAKWRKDFEADRNTRTARFYRVMNEVPAVLMVAIVLLVVIKPF